MNVKINVNVEQLVPQVLEDGLVLVILKDAIKKSEDVIVRLNSVEDLKENFEINTESKISSFNELYEVEYLLRTGANVLCTTVGAISETSVEESLGNIEDLNYRFILAPYFKVDKDSVDEDSVEEGSVEEDLLEFIKEIFEFVNENDVELFLNLKHTVTADNLKDIIDSLSGHLSHKVQLFKNFGLPRFRSVFDIPEDLKDGVNDFNISEGFFGVSAATAAVARKSKLLNRGISWVPVAGEQYGLANEFFKLLESFSKLEKTKLQANNVNVLLTKRGIGNMFVSQNTMLQLPDGVVNPRHPFYRGHVVTEAFAIKRELDRIANYALYRPNNSKTWTEVELKIKTLFKNLLEREAVEDFEILIGRGVTMTDEDIENGILKARVRYLPIRVIEQVEFNVVIQQSTNTVDIEFYGLDNLLAGGE